MDISIITPFYEGNMFLSSLQENIELVAEHTPQLKIEWIVVNDSPNTKMNLKKYTKRNLKVLTFSNSKNEGIHKTRINGFNRSSGKFILFLDQDDQISPDILNIHLNNIHNKAASITNGYSEDIHGNKKILYKSLKQIKCVNNISYYFYIGNIIASPGLVLIRKEAVPKQWLRNNLMINGADDWLLWVHFLDNGNKFSIDYHQKTYIHTNNAFNTSDNNENMLISSKEALDLFKKENSNNLNKLIRIYTRRLAMREKIEIDKKLKGEQYLLNPDIMIKLMLFKLLGVLK